MRRRLMLCSVLVCLAALPCLADGIVYTQPADIANFSFFASQNDPSGQGNFATVYDNFKLSTATSITDVHWTGIYAPFHGTITGFTLQFWSSNADQPGSSLSSQFIAGTANETFLFTNSVGNPVYTYSADLNSPFVAAAGTEYWLSIVPNLAAPPQWGWQVGSGGDGVAYLDFFSVRDPLSVDLAFDLTGTAVTSVPEPGSLLLLSTGVGLARAVRRKLRC